MLKRLIPQRLRNWWGSTIHRYGCCDACGNTFWRNLKGRYTVYTKERLPKPKYYGGSSTWSFCAECPPALCIPSQHILRVYQSEGEPGGLLCVECGRQHPANVCFSTHSESEVKSQGRGFPMVIEPGETVTFRVGILLPGDTEQDSVPETL